MRANADRSDRSDPAARGRRLRAALLWVGAVSAVSAVAALVVVRATVGARRPDPAADRIQSLIDEANSLLRSLDVQARD